MFFLELSRAFFSFTSSSAALPALPKTRFRRFFFLDEKIL